MVFVLSFTPISSLLYLYNLANIHIKEHLYYGIIPHTSQHSVYFTHYVILPHNFRPQNVLL